MRYFWKKQIHASCSTFSSRDEWLSREIDADTFAELSKLHDEATITDKVSVVYLEDDKRFYHGGFRSEPSKDVFQAYVQTQCKAFDAVTHDEFLETALSEHWKLEAAKETEQRRAEGFLFPNYDEQKEAPAEKYQGGFSDEVFNHPELHRYVSGGLVFGYIGHFVRKADVDAYLEKAFLAKSDVMHFAVWLTSTGGRHFGDSLEDCTFEEQCEYIDQNVDSIISDAKRYAKAEAANG